MKIHANFYLSEQDPHHDPVSIMYTDGDMEPRNLAYIFELMGLDKKGNPGEFIVTIERIPRA